MAAVALFSFISRSSTRSDSCLLGLQARSLLTSHEDYTTLMYHSGSEIQKPGAVFAFLKRSLPDGVVEEVQRMTLTTDGRCAVFDVPSKRVQVAIQTLGCPFPLFSPGSTKHFSPVLCPTACFLLLPAI